MRLAMSERRVLVKACAGQYQRGNKRERSAVLGRFVAASGYCRAYASWLLRWHGKRVRVGARVVVVGDATTRVRRRRERVYGAEVVAVVTRLWKLLRRPTESGHEFERLRTGGRRNADSDSRERGQMRVVVGGVSAIVVRVSTIVGGVSAIIRNLILAVCKAR